MTYEYYGLPADWLERYRAGIEKVTPADTARVARQYIKPDQFAILVVGPTEGRDKPLSTFGAVKTLDISIPEPPSATPAAPRGRRHAGRRRCRPRARRARPWTRWAALPSSMA